MTDNRLHEVDRKILKSDVVDVSLKDSVQ